MLRTRSNRHPGHSPGASSTNRHGGGTQRPHQHHRGEVETWRLCCAVHCIFQGGKKRTKRAKRERSAASFLLRQKKWLPGYWGNCNRLQPVMPQKVFLLAILKRLVTGMYIFHGMRMMRYGIVVMAQLNMGQLQCRIWSCGRCQS